MIDVEELRKIYDKYKQHKKELEKYKKRIKDYDKLLERFVDHQLNNSQGEDFDINKILNDNPEMGKCDENNTKMNFHITEINRILTSYFSRYSQFITIERSNKLYLVDLKYFDILDISDLDSSFRGFIIKMLKHQNIFIGNVKESELPLLMAIKEDIDYVPDLSDLPFEEREEERYFIESAIPILIQREYENTLLTDKRKETKERKLPFINNSDDVIREWNKLDELKASLTEEEYWIEYYKLLIIFGNNIEEVYQETDEDKKGYVIDAYYYYSSQIIQVPKVSTRIRTASSIINEEVLKRKIMHKTK